MDLSDNKPTLVFGNPQEYRDTFFTTFPAFTTADEVFQSLVHRFHDAEASYPHHHASLRNQ